MKNPDYLKRHYFVSLSTQKRQVPAYIPEQHLPIFHVMKPGQQQSNPFILISMGLLIGFFTGAGMVYYFFQKLENQQLSRPYVRNAEEMSVKKPEASDNNIAFQDLAIQTIGEDDKVLAVREMIIPREEEVRKIQALTQLDSLIGKTKDQSMQRNSILIIFYDSPNEQPGYIMSPKRLSFFGINDPDITSIRLIEGVLYLEYMDHYFALQNSPSIRPLMPLRDKQSIADIIKKWK